MASQYLCIGCENLELKIDEVAFRLLIRLAVAAVVLYLLWIFIFQGVVSAIESTLKKDALAKGEVIGKQICGDLDSLRKFQQEPNSANPNVLRLKDLVDNYKVLTSFDFNESRCQP